jgi:FtsP/CotA-like multicopper oxidase with cupredoxin domain
LDKSFETNSNLSIRKDLVIHMFGKIRNKPYREREIYMVTISNFYRDFWAWLALPMLVLAGPAIGDSFRVQCPYSTSLHPGSPPNSNQELGPNPAIKCQQISGGDGYATMADGTQTYLFAFSPLSGLDLIQNGQPGTQSASDFCGSWSTDGKCRGSFNSPTLYDGVSVDPQYDSTKPINHNGAITDSTGIMNWGVLGGNEPAPLIAIDEDDELFLTLSNVGMIMRPDLFEQHTVHFHGYPNAASYFDGVPDSSVAVNIAGSFTYYYTAPDAGTYFWHCHITPPEHLQMGMVGQLYVRPRQNKVSGNLHDALVAQNAKVPGTASTYSPCFDILCTGQTPPPPANSAVNDGTAKYAYNDGDGSTRYDVEYPIQMMGFDPNFHFVGMTFNPEDFAGMKDKYFMLNGRSYPDTANDSVPDCVANPSATGCTQASDGVSRPSQPLASVIKIPHGGRALLRISDLNVTEFHTLATVGIPMTVIAQNARLLRDTAGNNLYFKTNSINLGGGESADVIIDASTSDYANCSSINPCTYFLYTSNLDHLSNDAENFGGMMTEIVVN